MRLIDADHLIARLEEDVEQMEDPISIMFTYGAINDIKHEPTITVPHWIPVTERLPEEPFGCLVTVWDTNPVTMDEFENILPYFVGWDGEQWNDADGEQCPFEIIAWMPLPAPYQEGATDERPKN